ncbi:MAG: S41 family peptidase [Bacteroidia bacterium]
MKFRQLAVGALVILLTFSFGFTTTDLANNYHEISKNLDIFGHLYKEVSSAYVEETSPEELIRTGIDAMLKSLDPYTDFIAEEDAEDLSFMSTGQYGGIGAVIGRQRDRFVVFEVYEGYPADRAGMQPGDELVAIEADAVSTEKMDVEYVRNRLRGDKDTEIRLTIRRPGESQQRELLLTRDRVRVANVPYYGMANAHIGYIALAGFTQDAAKEVQEAFQNLRRTHGDELRGIVLDLRDNPGGRLDESVRVANLFIDQKEVIVETRGRTEGSSRIHRAMYPPVDADIPLAVLINSGSASASEIVTGALQDLDRAVIIGQRSFGKGLVQSVRPLPYNTQLKITIAKYYTPSGRCIQAINYADRHADGSVSRIPDSLKTAFQTRGGRIVYDGGGIEPDLIVGQETLPTAIQALQTQGLIFDYATAFVQEHPVIAQPRDFRLSDAAYQDFLVFVKEHGFQYQTASDEELEQLIETAKEESYAALIETELETLRTKLEKQKQRDLIRHKVAVGALIEREIARRYYYAPGEIQAGFRSDVSLQQALSVLEDETRYRAILSGEE